MGEPWEVKRGDCLELMRAMPADSVDLVFTSPPYVDARLYLEGGVNLGISRGPDEWVAWMLEVCREASRVCKGLCAFVVEGRTKNYSYDCAPFLLLADLRRAGFNMRKPPAYRRVGVPGSGGPDWLRNDWEPVVCFTRKGRLPWSCPTACGHPPKYGVGGEMSNRTTDGARVNAQLAKRGTCGNSRRPKGVKNRADEPGAQVRRPLPAVANPGNIIDCGAVGGGNIGSKLASENEAPFPEQLAELFVRTFCPPGGLVLDPFCGSGTTLACAVRWRRRALGFDLRASQVELSRERVSQETPMLFPESEPEPIPAVPTQATLFYSLEDA